MVPRLCLSAALVPVAVAVLPCEVRAAFPGENGLIAIANYDPGNATGQIATVTAEEEGAVTPLTTVTDGTLNDIPGWSPDGTRVAFYSNRDLDNEIYVMEADGSEQTRLTTSTAFDYLPAWASDGQSLFFASDRDGDFEIYRISESGGIPRKLTDNTARDYLAQASPDCSTVVFVSNRDGDDEIFVMDVYGRNQTQLTFNTALDIYPDWSPDGTKIAFASDRTGSMGRDIWIMDADGSDQELLIERLGSDTDPAFSPDGTMIAWSNDATGLSHVFVAPIDDVESSVNTTSSLVGKDPRGPDWQPLEPDGGFPEVECVPLIICGDANIDFDVKAGDAFQILRAAVGHDVPCIFPRCDADDNESILASDAQRVLRFAVGLNAPLNCPLP